MVNTEEHAYTSTEQLIKTIETIMNQNYFWFNNKIYKQEDEIPMGSPTSNILPEIFLQNLEDKHFDRIIKTYNIKLLARYVDDINISYSIAQTRAKYKY